MSKECRHKFEARYDLKHPPCNITSERPRFDNTFADNFYEKHYVHDICVKCGNVIKRGEGE